MVMDIRNLVPGHSKANLGKAQQTKKKQTGTSAGINADGDDSVSLTGQSSKISQLIEQMKAAPAVDPERVSPIKEKVDEGRYQIEYQQVANKMLDFEASYY